MQYEDDIAFQRAILASPADTMLKLVYADWLQDRADPRAEYVRRSVQLNGMVASESAFHAAAWLCKLGNNLDPEWVAFMTTLAQPFEPFLCTEGDPFADQVGQRGTVCVFESQYRKAAELNDGLRTDLAFLTSVEWGTCRYGLFEEELRGVVCDLRSHAVPPAPADIRAALQVSERGQLDQQFQEQRLFDTEGDYFGTHGSLKRYVQGGDLWYFSCRLEHQPAELVEQGFCHHVQLAVGRSPHGNRLVGVLAYRVFNDV
jgi:uncharacterized protein (TIGR02996 family)